MSDPTQNLERPPLWDVFDEAGRKWLEEVVQAFNDGGYSEMVSALLSDEAAAPGAVDE